MMSRAREQVGSQAVTVWSTLDATAPSGLPSDDSPYDTRDVDHVLLRRTQQYLLARRAGRKPNGFFRDAWKRFYDTHNPLVLRVVHGSGLRGSDRDDCTQEVWTAIVRRVPQFERDPSKGRFCCWIARLIHNRVVDFLRTVRRRTARRVALPEETPANGDSDPVAAYCRGERRRLVRHVLGHLEEQVSETNYRLVHLRWMEGQDVPTVAGELGLTSQQVWYRHHRVKKRLRRLLETHDGAWP